MQQILVVREAFVDCPAHVVAVTSLAAAQDWIERKFSPVSWDFGGFDTADGGSYLYDVCGVEQA